ncbi:hypothetical protein RHGRI_020801 [Rhododendron griersonianum]|uniref:Uncharacterized protein n=1 Tax=Rhododendron griersonianum TaxID=479676 RepID=A0AAV6JHM5_9ERIC|nr:hypothetical protein RHGRI_020801 [Rhododendron griersonianum]
MGKKSRSDEKKILMGSESPSDEKKMIEEPLLANQKGGFRTMPFILANEAFEKVASFGLMPNMIKYLMNEYHVDMATGSNLLFLWSAATNFMPLIGAFMADSSVGRFRMIGFGCIVSLLGMALLWLTTMIPQARPPHCNQTSSNCISPTTLQLIFLCSSFGLMSIGAGGIRSSSLAFGADQLEKHNSRKNPRALESYFSWYYVSTVFSILVAITCIVYLQDNIGWEIGFGVPVVLMFLSAAAFFLASPFYIKLKAKSSLLTGMFQVIVASYKNRHLEYLSSQRPDVLYNFRKGSMLVVPTEKLRFLDKACIIKDLEQDLTADGRASDPWSLLHSRPSRGAKTTNQGHPTMVYRNHDIRKPNPKLFPCTPSKFYEPPPHFKLRNPSRLFWRVCNDFPNPVDCSLQPPNPSPCLKNRRETSSP